MTPCTDADGAQIAALRYLLALARDDQAATSEARGAMCRYEPGLVVAVLAHIALGYAGVLAAFNLDENPSPDELVEGRIHEIEVTLIHTIDAQQDGESEP